jgi:prolyl oligopeptidase
MIMISCLSLGIMVDDDRVVPMHSFKLAATLQHVAGGNPHPLLLRVQLKAGHGAGKPTELK